MALTDRALSALDTASANSEGEKKSGIECLKRTLAGVNEARSLGLLSDEPWRLARAAESILGGVCASGEANGCLCDALCNLSASMESALGLQSADEIGDAAKLIEELACTKNGPVQAGSASFLKDHLGFKEEREALLLIGRVLVRNMLSELDDTDTVYTWDESLNL